MISLYQDVWLPFLKYFFEIALSLVSAFFAIASYINAKNAKKAAQETKERLQNFNYIEILSTITSSLQELQNCLSLQQWDLVKFRCTTLIKHISTLTGSEGIFSGQQKENFTNAIVDVKMVRSVVDKQIANATPQQVNSSHLNDKLTEHIESIQKILAVLTTKEK